MELTVENHDFDKSDVIKGIIGSLVLGLYFAPKAEADEVYLKIEDALRLVLGPDSAKEHKSLAVPEELQKELDDLNIIGSEEHKSAEFFTASKGGAITGYALINAEVGKHRPITYIVGISPAGKISRVELMVFRETHGWEVKERSFMAQFEGKIESEDLRIGSGIRNVTGATLSSQAISIGVKRALHMWKFFRSKGQI